MIDFDWCALAALCLFAGCSTDSHRGIYGAQRLIHEQIMWVGHSWTELLSIFPTHLKEGGKLSIFHHCKALASVEATNQARKQTRKMSQAALWYLWHWGYLAFRKKMTHFEIKVVASWQRGRESTCVSVCVCACACIELSADCLQDQVSHFMLASASRATAPASLMSISNVVGVNISMMLMLKIKISWKRFFFSGLYNYVLTSSCDIKKCGGLVMLLYHVSVRSNFFPTLLNTGY